MKREECSQRFERWSSGGAAHKATDIALCYTTTLLHCATALLFLCVCAIFSDTTSSTLILLLHCIEMRGVLGCTYLMTKRFPEAREISQGPSPRDIFQASGDIFPNTSPRQCTVTMFHDLINLHHQEIVAIHHNKIDQKQY